MAVDLLPPGHLLHCEYFLSPLGNRLMACYLDKNTTSRSFKQTGYDVILYEVPLLNILFRADYDSLPRASVPIVFIPTGRLHVGHCTRLSGHLGNCSWSISAEIAQVRSQPLGLTWQISTENAITRLRHTHAWRSSGSAVVTMKAVPLDHLRNEC